MATFILEGFQPNICLVSKHCDPQTKKLLAFPLLFFYSKLEFEWLSQLFKHLIGALHQSLLHSVSSENGPEVRFSSEKSAPVERLLSDLCSAASAIAGHNCVENIWQHAEYHLISAYRELCSLASLVEVVSVTEISILSPLQVTKVHLGMALTLLLCPTTVDPVMMKKVKNLSIKKIVSFGWILILNLLNLHMYTFTISYFQRILTWKVKVP